MDRVFFKFNNVDQEVFELSNLFHFFKYDDEQLSLRFKDESEFDLEYECEDDRDKDYKRLVNLLVVKTDVESAQRTDFLKSDDTSKGYSKLSDLVGGVKS